MSRGSINTDPIHVLPISGLREPVSGLSHLLAAPVFAILGYFLVQHGRGSWARTFSLMAMAASSVFMLLSSGIYHTLEPGVSRTLMLHVDVASIFMLIAGTATPVHIILFRGFNRWVPLVIVWSVAAAGVLEIITSHQILPTKSGTVTFLIMGWGGVISCVVLWRRFGFQFIRPLLCGGVAYTLGAIILRLAWPQLVPGFVEAHEIWHVAVLIGLGLHWKFVFSFASGTPSPSADPKNLPPAMSKSDT